MKIPAAICLSLAIGSLCVGASPEQTQSKDAFRKAFEWFDGLDFNAVRTGRFVRFNGDISVGISRWEKYRYGFLVPGSGSETVIVTLDLDHAGPEAGPFSVESYAPVSLSKYAKQQLQLLRTENPGNPTSDILAPADQFVICRACAARGLTALAQGYKTLLERAKPEHPVSDWDVVFRQAKPDHSYLTLDRWVREEIARDQVWKFNIELDNPDKTYPMLYGDAERLSRFFGSTEQGPVVEDILDGLRPLIAPKSSVRSMHGPIDRLIDALVNEQGQQLMSDDYPNVFWEDTDSPAHKLAKIGYPAVPKLIEAIADRRFTKSIGSANGIGMYALRVGDVARQILGKISAGTFWTSGMPIAPADIKSTQAAAWKWWLDMRHKS